MNQVSKSVQSKQKDTLEKIIALIHELEKESREFQEGLEIERALRMRAMCKQAENILTDYVCNEYGRLP